MGDSAVLDVTLGWAASFLEWCCPAEFSSNPNKTHEQANCHRTWSWK